MTGGKGADTFMASGGDDLLSDYNKGEGDAVDISNLLADADQGTIWWWENRPRGMARLSILDDGGSELGSVYL